MTPLAELDTTTPFGELLPGLRARTGWKLATAPWRPEWKRRIRRRVRGMTGPFDVRAEGLAFRAYPSENYCDRILVGRGRLPEWAEHRALEPYLEGGTFVDVGANVGTYSCFAGRRGARVIAFEPHPRTVEKLRFNLAANAVEAEVVNAAVGPASTTMELWSDGGGNVGQTSLVPEATSNAKVRHLVDVVSLLSALEERSVEAVDALKIDVEGFEDRALGPFLDAAPDRLLPRAVLIETEHRALWERPLMDDLAARGYRDAQADIGPLNALLVRAR